jgi:hypothetical protein
MGGVTEEYGAMADEGWKVEEETLTERAFFKAPFYTENLK